MLAIKILDYSQFKEQGVDSRLEPGGVASNCGQDNFTVCSIVPPFLDPAELEQIETAMGAVSAAISTLISVDVVTNQFLAIGLKPIFDIIRPL